MGMEGSFFELQSPNLENWISFRDVQMTLVSFFEIPYGDRLTKNVQNLRVQVIPRSTAYVVTVCRVLSTAVYTWVILQTVKIESEKWSKFELREKGPFYYVNCIFFTVLALMTGTS